MRPQSYETMGISGKESTIDRNGAGGDAGVTSKRNAILEKLNKIHQTGMPVGSDTKLPEDTAFGKTKRPGSATYKGGSAPSAQKNVPGGKSKQ